MCRMFSNLELAYILKTANLLFLYPNLEDLYFFNEQLKNPKNIIELDPVQDKKLIEFLLNLD
ncbi:MAG: hypothetical protein K9W46_00070 [Candidatus Heimdallarchaeum endolithica]|uniref:Uncharacterized protein n=1 Tax=Candidatus Heimdallarchaeum endolithica TaxID=2876572 RepID=A0A9Y1BRG5_9ARCH|nr:MAG: hypothetical protein K9W46_00070 [Candidatus Heimdallarchaeum endolithica]